MLDKEAILSDAQAITGDAVSTNSYRIRGVSKDIGTGKPFYVCFNIDQSFTLLTSLTISLIKSANSDLSSATKIMTKPTVLLASLTAGARIEPIAIPSGIDAEYVGVDYDVVGTNPDAGKITAYITDAPDRNVPTSDD